MQQSFDSRGEPCQLNADQEKQIIKKIKSPQWCKYLIDEPVEGQPSIYLFSWTPAIGAKPDKKGFYGMAKIRGAYQTTKASKKAAVEILTNNDNIHDIFLAPAGAPFALADDTVNVAQGATTVETIMKEIHADEKRKTKEREQEIQTKVDAAKNPKISPCTEYITKKISLLQLRDHISQHEKAVAEARDKIPKLVQEINDMHTKFLDDTYEQEFMESMKSIGQDGKDTLKKLKLQAQTIERPK